MSSPAEETKLEETERRPDTPTLDPMSMGSLSFDLPPLMVPDSEYIFSKEVDEWIYFKYTGAVREATAYKVHINLLAEEYELFKKDISDFLIDYFNKHPKAAQLFPAFKMRKDNARHPTDYLITS